MERRPRQNVEPPQCFAVEERSEKPEECPLYNSRRLPCGTASRRANGESKGKDSRLSTY